MTNQEVLYSDIPPTKLRNRKEKFRKPKNLPFWIWVADTFMFNMLENRFHSLRIKNEELFEKRNKNYPCIMYTAHGNWWDGLNGYNLMRRVFKVKTRMIIEEMNRFPLFSKVGAYPINKKSAQEAMKTLKFAVEDLNDPSLTLWIFPQGIIKPPNFRPIEFQTGMTYIAQGVAKKHGGVNLIPMAVNYIFLREDKPEILVQVGDPIILEKNNADINRHEYTNWLSKEYAKLADKQLNNISIGKIEGYRYLFERKLPWWKKLEKKLKNIDMPGSGI